MRVVLCVHAFADVSTFVFLRILVCVCVCVCVCLLFESTYS